MMGRTWDGLCILAGLGRAAAGAGWLLHLAVPLLDAVVQGRGLASGTGGWCPFAWAEGCAETGSALWSVASGGRRGSWRGHHPDLVSSAGP